MQKFKFSLIKFVPNRVRAEFINVGIIVSDIENKESDFFVPNNLISTKVKTWYPDMDTVGLSIILNTMSIEIKDALRDRSELEKIARKYSMGMFEVTNPTIIGSDSNLAQTLADLKANYLDLRERSLGGSIQTVSQVKAKVDKAFKKLKILGSKVVEEKSPLRIDGSFPPIITHYRWQNGVSQYIKLFSVDRKEGIKSQGVQNAWESSKSLIYDAQVLSDAHLGFSVVLQRPRSQANGELLEISDFTEETLRKFGVQTYSPDDLNRLAELISQKGSVVQDSPTFNSIT